MKSYRWKSKLNKKNIQALWKFHRKEKGKSRRELMLEIIKNGSKIVRKAETGKEGWGVRRKRRGQRTSSEVRFFSVMNLDLLSYFWHGLVFKLWKNLDGWSKLMLLNVAGVKPTFLPFGPNGWLGQPAIWPTVVFFRIGPNQWTILF